MYRYEWNYLLVSSSLDSLDGLLLLGLQGLLLGFHVSLVLDLCASALSARSFLQVLSAFNLQITSMRICLFLKTFLSTFRYSLWYTWCSIFLDSGISCDVCAGSTSFSSRSPSWVFEFWQYPSASLCSYACSFYVFVLASSPDQLIFDQLPNLLPGLGIGNFIGLIGVQPDLLFTRGR